MRDGKPFINQSLSFEGIGTHFAKFHAPRLSIGYTNAGELLIVEVYNHRNLALTLKKSYPRSMVSSHLTPVSHFGNSLTLPFNSELSVPSIWTVRNVLKPSAVLTSYRPGGGSVTVVHDGKVLNTCSDKCADGPNDPYMCPLSPGRCERAVTSITCISRGKKN